MKARLMGTIIAYSTLIVCSFYLLLLSRTKTGSFWTSVHPWLLPVYFVTTLFLAAIIMSKEKSWLKLSFVIVYSTLSFLFLFIVLDAGWGWDSWSLLGYSRRVYDDVFYDPFGWPWPFSFYAPRTILAKIYHSTRHVLQHSLPVIFARTFGVDVFWSYFLFVPLLFGIFFPVISYGIAKALCKEKRVAFLSAFLVTSVSSLVLWGAYSVPQSVGYLFFFFTLYLLVYYISHNKGLFPAIISALASFVATYITGILSFAFILLAFAFKRYQTMKRKKIATVELVVAFLVSASVLPLSYYYQQYFYPAYGYFTLSKLSELPVYDAIASLILSPYETHTVGQFITYGELVVLLGFLALVYNVFRPRRVNEQVCRFLLLTFLVIAVDTRIVKWFMVGVPFRIWPCASMIAIPAAAVAINNLIHFLSPTQKFHTSTIATGIANSRFFKFNVRKTLVIITVAVFVSAMAVSSVYNAYSGGSGVTGYELEAAKYIEENTPGTYVVICDSGMLRAGYAVVGKRNPRAYYPDEYDTVIPRIFKQMWSDPSPDLMREAAWANNADFQYFVASSRRPQASAPLSEVVEKASMYFELHGVFGDVENIVIYVFRYRTPPVASTSDVSAFYWDEPGVPSSYMVQNDLMRIVIPMNKSFEVRDFFGHRYEGILFNKTLVDGNPLGNVSKVEYFDSSGERWITWNASEEVRLTLAMKQQFRFRLLFEKVALVAVVERGKPFAQISWESLDDISHIVTVHLITGGYKQFLIPGLTENPRSVHSYENGAYYTISRTENVWLHYAYDYVASGSAIYPYQFKDLCKFVIGGGYLYYDLYVDNDADFGRWVYIEMYLPDKVSGGVSPPFYYSTNGGETWTIVYEPPPAWTGPLKTVNGTEVNWVVSQARAWSEKPRKWFFFEDAMGGEFSLPETFIDSGGCWNRIIFGMYLLGDTNPGSETFSGKDEGDQALLRIGIGRYGSTLEATYDFKDTEDTTYGLRNMNDVFLTFYAEGRYVGGVTFTNMLRSLHITATNEDKIDHLTFNVSCQSTFSLLAQFSESAAYESLAQLSYVIQESDNKISLTAKVTSTNDWDRPAITTICIPADYDYDAGELLFQRGLCLVLQVNVTDGNTEIITIWPE